MNTKQWAAFLGLSIAWGTSFAWIKIAVQEIGPVTMLAIRLLLGSLFLLAVAAFQKPAWPKSRQEWVVLAVIGITNTAVPFVLISWGQQYIDSTVSSILSGSVPLFVAILAHYFLKDDRLSLGRFVGVLVGFGGVVVLIGQGTAAGGGLGMQAQLAVLLAMVFYAFSAVYTRLKAHDISPVIQSLVPLIVADGLLWLLVPFTEMPFQLPEQLNTWGAILWLAVISSGIAYLLYYYLLHSIGPTRTLLVTYMFPLIGVISGAVFLGEQINLRMITGGALVLFSVLIVNNSLGNLWHWFKARRQPI
ncbi:MAG: DMT family transporter [Chloroflexota bacterium]